MGRPPRAAICGSVESVGDVVVHGDTVTTWVRWGDGSEYLTALELENGVIVRQHDLSTDVYRHPAARRRPLDAPAA